MSLYLRSRLLYHPLQHEITSSFVILTKSKSLTRSYCSSSLVLLQKGSKAHQHSDPVSSSSSSPPSSKPAPVIKPRFRPGDWICPHCQFHNYSRRSKCGECSQPVNSTLRSPQKGDWICPRCEYYNFRQRLSCQQCEDLRPSPSEIQQRLS